MDWTHPAGLERLAAYNVQSIAIKSIGPAHSHNHELARDARFLPLTQIIEEENRYGDGKEATLARN